MLGSAGGPRRALPLLDGARFLIVNGDTLTDADPRALAASHAGSGALVTMAVVPNARPPLRRRNRSDDGRSRHRLHTAAAAARPSWHFIGVQVAEAAACAGWSPIDPPSRWAVLPRLIARAPGIVRALRYATSFLDIGTPADYLTTSLHLAVG